MSMQNDQNKEKSHDLTHTKMKQNSIARFSCTGSLQLEQKGLQIETTNSGHFWP